MKQKITLLCIFLFQMAVSQKIWRTEMLGRPTDSSITLNLFFKDSAEVRVSYGTIKGMYLFQTAWKIFADSVPAEFEIRGLKPNTKYFYKVQYRKPGDSSILNRPEFSFHTQRFSNQTFTFVVQADPHLDVNSDSALYRLCLQNQLEDEPDFMIDLGDFLMTDKLKSPKINKIPFDTIPYRCNLLRSFYETETHSVPLFIANGNHEGESGWNLDGTPNNIAVWSSNERKKYFLNPAPNNFYSGDTTNNLYVGQRENYYSWTWGDALFVVLDPYWYTDVKPDSLHGWRWTLGVTQYNWLKKVLEQSKSPFKFVFAHHLIGGDPQGRGGIEFADLYEWGGLNLDKTPGFSSNRPGWYKPIKDLLTEHRVNIFFHGHDHFFDRQEKDCMIYQETPQPSLPNFNYPNQASEYGYLKGLIVGNSGHLKVTVDSSGTKVEYIRVFLPKDTNSTHHNKDIAASYYIPSINCYDSLATGTTIIWNNSYPDLIAYPNPFGQDTKIQFTVVQNDRLILDIYNNEGILIRRLLSGNTVSPGSYTVVWDGKDVSGNPEPSGIYHYALMGIKSKSHGKLILSK